MSVCVYKSVHVCGSECVSKCVSRCMYECVCVCIGAGQLKLRIKEVEFPAVKLIS